MKYLHNSSFEKTKAELEEKGCSYSNAVLDGTEYFYGLKRMENAEWTLIFLVPAEYVATNTLKLVNFVTIVIVIFTVIAAVCVMLGISFIMRRNQQEAIRVERENNARLETVNTELRQAKKAAEEAFQVAEEANRSKSSFLANMSHDIRTPMNAIIGITSLVRHDAADKGKVIEYADKIDISSQHLLGIINDVYPVMILGKNGWTKPVIEEATKSEINRAYIDSVYRSENQFEANFELNFMECSAEFSVPITVVEKLMNREDNETKNNVIFNIDIPFISDKGIKKFVSLEVFLEGFNRGDYTNKQISFFNFGE